MAGRPKGIQGIIGDLIGALPSGSSFFTQMKPTDAIQHAKKHDKKIKTQIHLIIRNKNTDKPICERITEITII